MSEFFFRTEDIRSEDVLQYFVETSQDRSIVDTLKGRNPTILVGSRGVGKSFLFRVAEVELSSAFEAQRVFPVYVTFNKTSLIHTTDCAQFQHWMLARVCARILRSLRKRGLLAVMPSSSSILAGTTLVPGESARTRIEEIVDAFESSWQKPGTEVDVSALPTVDAFKDAIEDLCAELNLSRFQIFIDEAAHVLIPEQQRQFFTLYRDLRSPHVTCNAAVYPGVTSFGETFQPAHDATMLTLDRDVQQDDYASSMREIVTKQAADSTISRDIARNGQNFALLAYASSGNPRILLKTLTRAPSVSSRQVNEVIRQYYRTDIWSEHSALADKYPGHRGLVDWGRRFIEEEVLPGLQSKNSRYLDADKKTTCFFWIHRDSPEHVKEALRLLAYTGIVTEHATGIKATRSEIGTRYAVNLGCLFSLESVPTDTAFQIAKNITPKRTTEYGAAHGSYQDLLDDVPEFREPDMSEVLRRQIAKPIDVLDITEWQKQRLTEVGLDTVGDVLEATETRIREAYYVGQKRARRARNAATAAVYEYLSG